MRLCTPAGRRSPAAFLFAEGCLRCTAYDRRRGPMRAYLDLASVSSVVLDMNAIIICQQGNAVLTDRLRCCAAGNQLSEICSAVAEDIPVILCWPEFVESLCEKIRSLAVRMWMQLSQLLVASVPHSPLTAILSGPVMQFPAKNCPAKHSELCRTMGFLQTPPLMPHSHGRLHHSLTCINSAPFVAVWELCSSSGG